MYGGSDMKLVKGNTDFNFSIVNGEANNGLSDGDYWCLVNYNISNSNINLCSSKLLISRWEYDDLIKKLKLFLSDDFIKKGRIAFIKNYFILYLDASVRKERSMKMKLVHINDNDDNYMLYFNEREINEFLNCLESFRDKI